eukprot:403353584
MESTAPSTETSSTQGVISQNLTVEDVKKKLKSEKYLVRQGGLLARGAYGTVYTADIFQRVHQKVAMKEDQDTEQEELVLLQPLAMYDLNQFLIEKYPEGNMPENQAIEFLTQLTIGTKAMHDNKVIHRDLNPRNILVFENDKKTALNDQEYILRISDFGCSKILKLDENEAMTRVGKPGYMPPEQHSFKGYNQSVDIYALGLTMFEMITGKLLTIEEILSQSVKPKYYSPEFIDLLYQLCSISHNDRPTVDEIIQNPIIQKSQTFFDYFHQRILPMSRPKRERTIDNLKDPQKLLDVERVFYQMNRVMDEFKYKESEWQAQYDLAIGNNDKQYFINQYKAQLVRMQQNLEKLRDLERCTFKREVEADGNIFVGIYKDGNKHFGRQYEQDNIKEGQLRNGEFDGEACEYAVYWLGYNIYYDGKYANGKWNGNGMNISSKGNMYCGEFLNGNQHGLGTYYYSNGDHYEGQWLNNNKHGEGEFKYASGNIAKGSWKDDQYDGEFIKTYAYGKQEKITYQMDKEISREQIELE